MGKKTLAELFEIRLTKNKTIQKKQIKKSIDDAIVSAIVDSFKSTQSHELDDFGTLRKTKKIIDGKTEGFIEFFPNQSAESKILKKYSLNLKNPNKPGKKIFKIIATILLIALLLGISIPVYIIYLHPKVAEYVNKITEENTKKEKDKLLALNKVKKDSSSDSKIFTDSSTDVNGVKKETINFKTDKEVSTNEDKSLIIKTQAINDTKLKTGEFEKSIVEIEGKKYDKYVYIIKEGDTLWWLADKFLLNPFKWPTIHKDNPYIENPNLIYPNYKLTIYTLIK
jgi:nucleoid-associated protein YgaU